MGHLLEKQIVVAVLCLSVSTPMLADRKEDLERAAELAVERSAERAAERAVEKALEAGNKTSTTITVKESYSNARKIAEEQAAPGSESTRQNTGKTSIFESKEFPESSGYDSPLNEPEYTDYNDSRSAGEYYDSRGYDYNDSKGYNDYNDSRSPDDYESVYEDEPRNFRDYDAKDYNESSKSYKDPKGFSESSNEFRDQDPKTSSDYEESKLEEDDYSFPKDTDYQKLNASKPNNPEISATFGDFDSDFRNEFGSKLNNAGAKLPDGSLEDDIKFYPTETDFLKKKDSEKQIVKGEEEPEYKDEDSWKSYSDWHKDFKSIGEGGSFWDDEDDSPLKIFSEDEDILPADAKKTEEPTEYQRNSHGGAASVALPTDKPPEGDSSSKDFDFSSIKSWQSDDDEELDDNVPAADAVVETDALERSKSSKLKGNSYRRRSSRDDNFYRPGPVYRGPSRESDDESITTTTTTTTERITTMRSPVSRFRNAYRERSRGQYEKIMLGKSSDEFRRPTYKFDKNFDRIIGSRFQNYSDFERNSDYRRRNGTEVMKRPFRVSYSEESGSKNTESYAVDKPYDEVPTTYRNFPKIHEEKMTTRVPSNRSSAISPSITMNPLQGNHHKNLPRIFRKPSLVQLPPTLSEAEKEKKAFPPIPSSVLTVPKSSPKEVVQIINPHPYDPYNVIHYQAGQPIIPTQRQQQLVVDAPVPVFINTALPGPLQVTKQTTVADNKPYTIHLDKSIPIALRKRMPFIVHFPLKPYEKHVKRQHRVPKIVENDSAASENRLRKMRWSAAG